MELRHLRQFICVARCGSLHHASEILHIAQPAISRTIKALEDEVGLPLFSRHSRGMSLTPAGEALYIEAEEILQRAAALRSRIHKQAAGRMVHVSIGAPPALAPHLFVPVAKSLALTHPQTSLSFVEGVGHKLLARMIENKLDIAILGQQTRTDRVESRYLFSEATVLIEPAGGEQGALTLLELQERPLILATKAENELSWIERQISESGTTLDLTLRYRVESPQVALDLVRAGLGHAVLPASGILGLQGDDSLSIRPLRDLHLPRHLVYQKAKHAAGEFGDVVDILAAQMLQTAQILEQRVSHLILK